MFTIKLIRHKKNVHESTVYSCRCYIQTIMDDDPNSAEYVLKGLNGSEEEAWIPVTTKTISEEGQEPLQTYDKIFIMNEQGKTVDSFVAK